MRSVSDIFREILRFACVIALVMVGFAHKPVSAYPAEAQMPVYELPDGTFATICFADHDSKPHASKDFGCDACRLSSTILVPEAPCLNGRTISFSGGARVFERRQRLARTLYHPGSGPRAPPPASLMFV
jgi:hypothetical protein